MKDRILQDLRNHAEDVLRGLNMELSPVALENLIEMLNYAASRMVREERTSSIYQDEARRAVGRLISETFKDRQLRAGQRALVSYSAIISARNSICPLWPIC